MKLLFDTHHLDELNPFVHLSLGAIHTALGNPERAGLALATADELLQDEPHLTLSAVPAGTRKAREPSTAPTIRA